MRGSEALQAVLNGPGNSWGVSLRGGSPGRAAAPPLAIEARPVENTTAPTAEKFHSRRPVPFGGAKKAAKAAAKAAAIAAASSPFVGAKDGTGAAKDQAPSSAGAMARQGSGSLKIKLKIKGPAPKGTFLSLPAENNSLSKSGIIVYKLSFSHTYCRTHIQCNTKCNIFTHTNTHTHTHTHTHTYTHTHIRIFKYTCFAHTQTNTHIHTQS
jgi:hypothetical protein